MVTCSQKGKEKKTTLAVKPVHHASTDMKVSPACKVGKLVVHQLIKKEKEKVARVDISTRTIHIDARARSLVCALNDSYLGSVILFTHFDLPKQKEFHDRFKAYLAHPEGRAFLTFTKHEMHRLKDKIESIYAARGGYLVFAEYVSEAHHYFSGFLIRDTKGLFFMKKGKEDTYTINELEHLDLTRLSMAFRIDVDEFNSAKEVCLSVISRDVDLSRYFLEWIGAKLESSRASTQRFLKVLEKVIPRKDPQSETLRQQIYDYFVSNPNKVFDLADLGAKVFEDEDRSKQFAEVAQKNKLNLQFRADTSTMKRLTLIHQGVKDPDILVQFPRSEYTHKNIRLERGSIVIKNAQLYEILRKELKGVPVQNP